MPWHYTLYWMCRLVAAVVLRSACTPAAVTLLQEVERREHREDAH
jgi:hypothetical protein